MSFRSWRKRTLAGRLFPTLLVFLGFAASPPPLRGYQAQETVAARTLKDATPGDTVWVTPRSRFDANALQRLFLGNGYRDLWAMPFQVEVLDLALLE